MPPRLDRRRSATAEGAALARAAVLREANTPDRALERLLPFAVRHLIRWKGTRRLVLRLIERFAPGMPGYHLARTRFFDERLTTAVHEGARQVVILCAGLDTRVHRLRHLLERVTVFEVDHPRTSTWKQALVNERLGKTTEAHRAVRYVACDLRTQSLGDQLLQSGFAPDSSAFVIWEGATMYLDANTVAMTLGELARVTLHVSVAFDYLDRRALEAPSSFAGAERNMVVVARRGEPYVFGLEPAQAGAFLGALGFELATNLGAVAYPADGGSRFPPLAFGAFAEASRKL